MTLLSRKNFVFLFKIYLLSLFLIAVLPLNGDTGKKLDNTFILTFRLDHLLHSLLYVPYVLLYLLAVRPPGRAGRLLLIGAGILTAIATEGIQYFLPYRGFSIVDMISNLFGVLAGSLALLITVNHDA